MELELYSILGLIGALVLGLIAGYFLSRVLISKRVASANAKAEAMLTDAKSKSQDLLLEAKNKSLKLLEDAKKEETERRQQLMGLEKIVAKREEELDGKLVDLEKQKETLIQKGQQIEKLKTEMAAGVEKQKNEIERVAGMKKDEAMELLLKNTEKEYSNDLLNKIKKLEQDNNAEIEKRAREVVTLAIQRYSSSQIADVTSTVVSLPSDDVKGKIIGKEGRNIKTIERLTGVDVIIDDTPEALVVSGFDPVRRQIAKTAIDKLIADGRIHPARIEEVVEKSKEEINEKIRQAGEAALLEVGVGTFDPKLVFLLGRLAFRTSYGQNVLLHSIEMAHIAGMLAEEIGANVMVAKKGALFHDIGKAVDHEVQGTHVEIGRKILKKFNVDERVIGAMEAHHEEYPYSSIESRLVQAADAISGGRPGARRDTVEAYLKRLEDLENIANSFDGVEKTYAIQAGRELRVFVTPSDIDDLTAIKLSRDIAKKIQDEMQYPGEIKVTVIRETRAIEYAR
ncbi:MAG: ribonuclease Y [Candidatus Yanofskybacteria bacterium CG10_big_fil_rev_8_21_14_0_10_36_16]|uniref:Ribonuclease Y n=1 Tax=Candidatus Yanofskybacteria bacterium CG10_big_fil_rev_8_21_14_0_10_36_16 TaxID=1975096 RepID=A0A2J0Q7P9_9BACT|nr:MAG: ribonuclease Y [Candidatus Yanofskybacteria bacterium CG10_big_fil_rev_8_21_14_0_10_36_16]